ncbi:hypothetical protein [Paenirhodobacter sp.]|uniref:hypothetical protein n=1 Tax=Paenirhodobacter sp. TaxID=1965326 RepID=UPI003B3D5C7B
MRLDRLDLTRDGHFTYKRLDFPAPAPGGPDRQHFDSIQHATRAIGDWVSFYNNRRLLSGACNVHAN